MLLAALMVVVGQGAQKPVSPVLVKNGNQLVEVSTLARWVSFSGYEDQKEEKVVFIRDGRILEFTVGSSKMMANGKVVTLPLAPIKSDGEIFLPLKPVANACGIDVILHMDKETITLYDRDTKDTAEAPVRHETKPLGIYKTPTPEAEKHYHQAIALKKEYEDKKKAEAEIRLALKTDPGQSAYHLLLGQILSGTDRKPQAREEYKSALAYARTFQMWQASSVALKQSPVSTAEVSAESVPETIAPPITRSPQNLHTIVGKWEHKDYFKYSDGKHYEVMVSRYEFHSDGTGRYSRYDNVPTHITVHNFFWHVEGATIYFEYQPAHDDAWKGQIWKAHAEWHLSEDGENLTTRANPENKDEREMRTNGVNLSVIIADSMLEAGESAPLLASDLQTAVYARL